eukprot:CAMPEP_0172667370 /NCGR_PEP_ID=MMETSP1074-20121228/8378_1 /TAXON_ID=2916 /ORGANISM="Ceratium fusus, Strain PA161109" /LENGTH=309 /DNA_ID=CAMNT_0013483861 /DNA_START=282 /DNA_END=1212 /DNA_ORIENTATION=-
MAMQLYHVTNFAAAEEIRRTQRFKCGEGGFAGGAIYFSEKEREARKRSRMGSNVVIACWVHLGRVFQAPRKSMNRDLCKSLGYDSVKINGIDVYAVYDASRIEILHFKDHHTGNELSSPPTVAETRIDDTLNDMVDSGQSQSKPSLQLAPSFAPQTAPLATTQRFPSAASSAGPHLPLNSLLSCSPVASGDIEVNLGPRPFFQVRRTLKPLTPCNRESPICVSISNMRAFGKLTVAICHIPVKTHVSGIKLGPVRPCVGPQLSCACSPLGITSCSCTGAECRTGNSMSCEDTCCLAKAAIEQDLAVHAC